MTSLTTKGNEVSRSVGTQGHFHGGQFSQIARTIYNLIAESYKNLLPESDKVLETFLEKAAAMNITNDQELFISVESFYDLLDDNKSVGPEFRKVLMRAVCQCKFVFKAVLFYELFVL